MSLEKLYNYVCGVMQRSEICIDGNDKIKMLELLPLSKDLRSTLSGGQSHAIRNMLKIWTDGRFKHKDLNCKSSPCDSQR